MHGQPRFINETGLGRSMTLAPDPGVIVHVFLIEKVNNRPIDLLPLDQLGYAIPNKLQLCIKHNCTPSSVNVAKLAQISWKTN